LQASVNPSSGGWAGGWEITLPLRAEHVTIEKQSVVVEEVVVRRRPLEEVVHLENTVQLERLRLETRGDLEATRPIGVQGTEEEAPGWTRRTERSARVRPES
jgi:stress response protein YsnF